MRERLPGLGRAGGDEAPLPPGGQSAQAPGGAAQHTAAKMETIWKKVTLLTLILQALLTLILLKIGLSSISSQAPLLTIC